MRSRPTAPQRSSLPSVAASTRRGRCCGRLLALAEERGETRFGAVLTLHLCELELRAGELREASRLLDEWAESGAMEGMETAHARCRALLASLEGRPDEVERWAAEAVPPTATGDLWDMWDELEVLRAHGIAALFAHEPERAAGMPWAGSGSTPCARGWPIPAPFLSPPTWSRRWYGWAGPPRWTP